MARKKSVFGVSRVIANDEKVTKIIASNYRKEDKQFSDYAKDIIKKQGFIPTY